MSFKNDSHRATIIAVGSPGVFIHHNDIGERGEDSLLEPNQRIDDV